MGINGKRLLVAALVSGLALAACGGGTSSSGGSGASSAGTSIAALKAKVQGKSLALGFDSDPDLIEVEDVELVQILKTQFGVNTTYKTLDATVMASGVVSGSLDVGTTSLSRVAGLAQGGANPLVIASSDYRNDYVMLGKAPIKTVADLKGHSYVDGGVSGPIGLYNDGCFKGTGISLADVKAVHLAGTGAATKALATPQFDAGLVHADGAAILQAEFPGKFNILCLVYQKVKDFSDVWFANRSWVQANPDMAQALVVASLLAARWVYTQRDQWLAVAAGFVPNLPLGVPESTYAVYTNQIQMWSVNGGLDLGICQALMAQLVAVKSLTSAPDCSSFMTLDYQTQARSIVGTVPELPPPTTS